MKLPTKRLGFRHVTPAFTSALVLFYGAYLLKTALGVNVSSSYSASWIFKVPLEPLWAHKAELCAEFQTLCSVRSSLRHRVQSRLDRIKGTSPAG